MFNAQKPDSTELPSTSRLLKSTGIAAVIASALLVLVVLPAEYGVDPTGAGSLLGLTEMGRIKMQLAEEAKAEAAADGAAATLTPQPVPPAEVAVIPPDASAIAPPQTPAVRAPEPPTPPTQTWSDTTTINLAPDESFEVKLVMEKGAKATFEWSTNGPGVNYDTHADGEGIKYHGYGKGSNTPRQAGELVAAFTGQHGWFWRNRTDGDVTITLRTRGDYTDLKQYD
jgi:hypothetical protein